jgi:predicted membrane channel-forming protein YqfA (hemolysin III family)
MSTTSTYNPEDSRVNVVIRLCGVMFFALGFALIYETSAEAGVDTIQQPLIPVLYLCALMLMLAGLVALFAKYKSSGAGKAS